MTTLFTKIIKGKIPAHKILENDQFLAFLDIRPIKPGHTLVIPKREVDYVFDLDDKILSNILIFSKRVAKMIEKAVECKRVGIMVAGLEVPHAHIHLIPMTALGDLNFANAKEVKDDALKQMSEKISRQGE
ncbi:MAG: HIT family protein [Candidatus Omnitrophica bacterium]|nr:HIT family protein [Candidatus Omnitrophota bacterium]MCF7892124.1 HIT family protein [Candidatus Omnitrophota bacterium]MCF7897778.1 HIT family protein [Candidatus Omnitrophota bacterium]MCF7909196.1 HIT family protein [Candidatus Omnitrophota bacterium]